MSWELIHAYRNLANESKVNRLTCPDCGTVVVSRIRGDDDDPWLWCPNCDSWTKPGLDFYDRIRAIVKEFNV